MEKFITFILLFTLNSVASNAEVFKGVGYSKDSVNDADSIALLSLSKLFKVKVVNEYTKSTISDNFYSNSEIKHNISVDSGIDFGTTKIDREVTRGVDGTIKVVRSIDTNKHLREINKQIDSLCDINNVLTYLHSHPVTVDGKHVHSYWFNFLLSYTNNLMLGNYYKSYQLLDNEFMDIINYNNIEYKKEVKNRVYKYNGRNDNSFIHHEDGKLIGVKHVHGGVETDGIKKPTHFLDTIVLTKSQRVQYEVYMNNEWVGMEPQSKYENLYVDHIIDISHLKNRFEPIKFRVPFITIKNGKFIKMDVPDDWYRELTLIEGWFKDERKGEHMYKTSWMASDIRKDVVNGIISYEYGEKIMNELREYILSIDPKAEFN